MRPSSHPLVATAGAAALHLGAVGRGATIATATVAWAAVVVIVATADGTCAAVGSGTVATAATVAAVRRAGRLAGFRVVRVPGPQYQV